MDVPKSFVPDCNLDKLVEKALKERTSHEGLIFAANAYEPNAPFSPPKDSSNIYVYDRYIDEPLRVGHRNGFVRSFCYCPGGVVYDAGDYRTIFDTFENKVVKVDGNNLFTKSIILSIAYFRRDVYYTSLHQGIFRLSDNRLVAERKDEVIKENMIIQSLFVFNDKLCDATRMGKMRFTETDEIIRSPSNSEIIALNGIRHVAVYDDAIYDSGEYGIRNAFEDVIVKQREGPTLALLPFGDKLLDAGGYCSIQDVLTDRCFLPFDKHITAMEAIPLNIVANFRDRYGSS